MCVVKHVFEWRLVRVMISVKLESATQTISNEVKLNVFLIRTSFVPILYIFLLNKLRVSQTSKNFSLHFFSVRFTWLNKSLIKILNFETIMGFYIM